MQLQLSLKAQSLAYVSLEQVLQKVQQHISILQLLKFVPQYLHHQTITQLLQNLSACQPNYITRNSAIIEQRMQDVPKISIDNLVPKNVNKQAISPPQLSQLGKSAQTVSPKLKLNKKRTSFVQGLNGSISSIRQSQQMSKMQQSVNSVASKNINKKQSLFISLALQPQQTEDIKTERFKKDKIVAEFQRQKAFQKRRQKQLQQKMQSFNSAYQSKDYTFSFEGDIMDAQAKVEGKIKHNGLSSRIGGYSKKMRDDFKFVDQTSKSLNLKKGYRKQNNVQNIQAAEQIPMPSGPSFKIAHFGPPVELQKYKLIDYKKHYGGKFHRLDRSMMNTIDVINNEQDSHDQLFNSRRDIKDVDQNLKTLGNSRRHQIARKIALPRLKGRYKCLDRYQQI